MNTAKKLLLGLILVTVAACSKSGTEQSPAYPATRTIFIGSGEITVDYEKNIRKPIRIMIDTLETSFYFDFVYSKKLAEELNYQQIPNGWNAAEYFPYYDILPLPVTGSYVFFAGYTNHHGIVGGSVADLTRQQIITGQQIDMVIGFGGIGRLVDDFYSWDKIWAHLTDSEGHNLLEYHTDVRMEVPYDWGMGAE